MPTSRAGRIALAALVVATIAVATLVVVLNLPQSYPVGPVPQRSAG